MHHNVSKWTAVNQNDANQREGEKRRRWAPETLVRLFSFVLPPRLSTDKTRPDQTKLYQTTRALLKRAAKQKDHHHHLELLLPLHQFFILVFFLLHSLSRARSNSLAHSKYLLLLVLLLFYLVFLKVSGLFSSASTQSKSPPPPTAHCSFCFHLTRLVPNFFFVFSSQTLF